ncbi:flavonol synthase/flavanone 3-hydroxylase [Hymenopellis radicata]|nr:flavonol synthase/flavanone 3-hydroxylase [Hymenopellis radicata]
MPGVLLSSLPTIDFSKFGDGTSAEDIEIGQQFYAACRDVGFAYLINTGIPQDKVDDMFKWSAKLFALPHEIKMKAPHPPEGHKHRGYSGIGVEQVSQMVFDPKELSAIRHGKAPDFKESFDMGIELEDGSERLSNIWIPEEDIPVAKLLPALAIGMGLDKDFFLPYHATGDNQLRLLHYPEAPVDVFESGEKGRIGAHTDFGTGTLLFQDDCGGLEVESPHTPGMFIPAPPIRGAAVFNIGDFLMRWSNDTLKSTLHRVRAPPTKEGQAVTRERFSIPYFMTADRDKTIDCLPGCFGPDRPKKYEPINSGQYTKMRLNATYV